jgi:RNA polymerase sigma-54 factor
MTPQLQQAIKLLQLSNVELAEYVETEIERNPLLTRAEGDSVDGEATEKVSEKREEMRLDEADGASKASNDLDARRMSMRPRAPPTAAAIREHRVGPPLSSTGRKPARASSAPKTSILKRSPEKRRPSVTISTNSSRSLAS